MTFDRLEKQINLTSKKTITRCRYFEEVGKVDAYFKVLQEMENDNPVKNLVQKLFDTACKNVDTLYVELEKINKELKNLKNND